MATPAARRVSPKGGVQGRRPCKTSGGTPRKCILPRQGENHDYSVCCNRKHDNLTANCLLLVGKPPNPP